ncbi:MAG: iron ABC transporter permease [Corynebacterium sp.]|nr:iron ABC transporter permease [Corynebacterium sp.]
MNPTATQKLATFTILLGLCVILGIFILASLYIGARSWVDLPGFHEFMEALAAAPNHPDQSLLASVINSRIPRTINAILAGAGLALAGTAIQGLTRNPLADPGLLGINYGAALCVVLGFLIGIPASLAAIIGALLTSALVYALSRRQSMVGMVLVGAAVSSGASALISALVLRRNDTLDDFRTWQIGGLSRSTVTEALHLSPLFLVGFIVLLASARGLDILALGEDMAASLGINLNRYRIAIITAITLLCAGSVALVGPLGFVGLIVPHMVRALLVRFTGVRHTILVPAAALSGASLVLFCDIIGRILTPPAEIPVGLSLAVIGVPLFLFQLNNARGIRR